MNWLTEFFRAIPDVVVAFWEFGGGWRGVGVTIGSVVLIAGFIAGAVALRDHHGWVAAIFGTMAATIGAWWLFGILPSAWIYFVDSRTDLLENTVIPGEIVIGNLGIATNFYEVFRDMVVMGETTIAMAAMVVLALMIQKRSPRGLVEGEEQRPTSGGYR